jgi:ribosomal-protein-alanine N-acetyltransferase
MLNEIISLRSNKEAMKYIARPLVKTAEEALQFQKIIDGIKNNKAINWAITLQNEGLLISTIGFWKVDKEHPSYRNWIHATS